MGGYICTWAHARIWLQPAAAAEHPEAIKLDDEIDNAIDAGKCFLLDVSGNAHRSERLSR